ncbi:hypothetical protein T459_11347 [Capsicum annuum]|uniref:Uncharacterized protein n=1 Tax=Capsicum annuum TaxID=4072 RepID=A0A2G2ZLW5_CAPAN|nr:hypothetical protein T459_11347 [Capsicum annuum]
MDDEDVQIYLNDINGEGEGPHDNDNVLLCHVENKISLDNEDVLPCQVERDAPLANEVDVQLPELLKDATIRSHFRYATNHSCDLRSISGRYRHASAKVIVELIKERFREGKARNPSIKKADAIVYNQAHHRVFTRQLSENIRTNYHVGSSVLSLYYLVAKIYRIEEFNEYLEEIRRKGYGNVVEYLENFIGFKRWSRSHFPGHMYDVITSNIVESVNARLVTERELPIIALFNAIQKLLCRWFHERRGLTLSTNNYLTPAVNALVRETRREIVDKLSVHQLHVNDFIVQGDGQDARVNVNAKTCTCRVWDLQ